ncbi:MAG: MFS transporter [Porticoccaceae bacterium]|nr:MFS transporter [Porticoccaceae bacterium]
MKSHQPEIHSNKRAEKQESLLLNLLCNIILPTLILTKLSNEDYLGIKLAIIVALAFPLIYGLHDFITRGKLNFFSGLGVVSVSLTGGISLLEMDAIYIAIKEASIPGVLGVATLLSLKTSQPLIHTLLLNDKVFDVSRINQALDSHNRQSEFDQLLINASWILAGSFFLSSLLNYLLAVIILTAEPGTVAFNEQLGKMTALSFPVIALPAMGVMMGNVFYLFRGIKKLTGLELENIVKQK